MTELTAPASRLRTVGPFLLHYLEMIAVMFAGMAVVGLPLGALLGVVGVDTGAWYDDAPALSLVWMSLTMAVPMAAWMRWRGHGWAPISEMTGAMLVPTAAAVGLLVLTSVDELGPLMAIEHVGMVVAMLAVMLLRVDEYSHRSGARA
jgi:hypothetical protein